MGSERNYCAAGYASGVRKTKRTFGALFLSVFFCGVWLADAGGRELLLPVGIIALHGGLEIRFLLNLVPRGEAEEKQENGE